MNGWMNVILRVHRICQINYHQTDSEEGGSGHKQKTSMYAGVKLFRWMRWQGRGVWRWLRIE